jgi:hypothetical protein
MNRGSAQALNGFVGVRLDIAILSPYTDNPAPPVAGQPEMRSYRLHRLFACCIEASPDYVSEISPSPFTFC